MRASFALVLLALVAALTVWDVAPPAPAGAEAAGFSAERAFRHVEAVAKAPRPTGSAENDRVREHLLAELRELGFETRVHEAVGKFPRELADDVIPLARTRNIIAVRPGTAPTGKVVLAGHYDSVHAGPGAADDGIAVATMLETASRLPRALKNDLVLLFTDGEEVGLLGAEALTRERALGDGPVVVVNNEARGVTGPVLTFRASAGSAPLMSLYGSAVPHPAADSGFAAIMKMLPNDTDFTAFTQANWLALDSAIVGGGAYYHTPLDDPAHLDRGSLQQMGENTLALATALGAADLATLRNGQELVYFNVPGLFVRYPAWLELPVALLGLVAAGLLVVVLRRRALLSLPATAAAAGLALLPVAGAAGLAAGFMPLLELIRPEYAGMLLGDPYRPGLYQAALLVATAALVAGWFVLLRGRRLTAAALGAGGVVVVALLGVLSALFLPGGSHPYAWPALAAALGWLAALRLDRTSGALPSSWPAVAALTLGLAPGAVLLVGSALSGLGLGLVMGGLVAAPTFALFLLLVTPLMATARWPVPALAAVVALALTGGGLAVDRFDVAHPRQQHLAYALDTATGKAAWSVPPAEGVAGGPVDAEHFFGRDTPAIAAPPAPLAAPEIKVLADESAAAGRTVRVRLSGRNEIGLEVTGGAEFTVGGIRVGRARGVAFLNPPPEGVEVTLVLKPGPAKVRAFSQGFDLSVVPGYRPAPDLVNLHPSATAFRDQSL
ncbi:M28 family peptidase [Nonomuraea sp. NPDC050310]|uniref:M28 family peptidase n=1 Tax=Nonomuraea sp. NPDC050310 TaxID=3154935 RepID=UPI0033E168B7